MILKILLTLAVVIAVYIWFRMKKAKQLSSAGVVGGRVLSRGLGQATETNTWIKPLVYATACLSVLAGILVYYLSWQDDHTEYQITITNPQTGSSERYIAFKKDMYGRMFITEGGLQISVSELERIEIRKLDSEHK